MKNINILITGCSGQLGRCILDKINEYSSDEINIFHTDTDHTNLDIKDSTKIMSILNERDYDYLINCAAYTNVAKAEQDFEDKCLLANAYGPKILAECCSSKNVKLIHISTDYVFDGSAEVKTETSKTNPLNRYGKTKLLGDTEIISVAEKSNLEYMILRTSWVYSEYGTNFVKTIFNKLANHENAEVVYDQIGSPTYAGDLANFIIKKVIVENNFVSGIFNYSNLGNISWYDFAKEIEETMLANVTKNVKNHIGIVYPTITNVNILGVQRPMIGILSKDKLLNTFGKSEDVTRYWNIPLKIVLRKLIQEKYDE